MYAAESPTDTELFQAVGKKIGIFDANGNPTDYYMQFITDHYTWGGKPETRQFKQKINTREKAREYIKKHLPR